MFDSLRIIKFAIVETKLGGWTGKDVSLKVGGDT